MSLKVIPIGVNYVHQAWPHVKQFVDAAVAEGQGAADYGTEHVLQYLASGQWVLFVAVDEEQKSHGACTVSFINYPLHRVAFVTTYGGKFLSNDVVMEQFKTLLKANGATKIEAYCRESMVRLLGKFDFQPKSTMVEVTI